MVLNYLKLSLRLMSRNPFFTALNVLGLSLGFAAFFILWQHSQNELRSDQFHNDHKQIYRLITFAEWTDNDVSWQGSLIGLSSVGLLDIVTKNTAVLEHTRLYQQAIFSSGFPVDHQGELSLTFEPSPGDRTTYEESSVAYAEPNFFEFFSFPLASGNVSQLLAGSESIVISEKMAAKYFGSSDPMGKTLYLNREIGLTVTGVFKDLPHNTHFAFDAVISANRIRNYIDQKVNFRCVAYCKLPVGAPVEAIADKINGRSSAEVNRAAWGNWRGGRAQVQFQPLTDIAFEPLRFDLHQPKSSYLMQVFSIAAIIILAMAWINQINLSISTGARRMKELAARKTVGARRRDFILQFLIEALLINSLSGLLALTWTQLLRAPAEILLQFHVPALGEIPVATHIAMGCIVLGGILITGSYLAIVSLRRSPMRLNQLHAASHVSRTNGILAVVQFAATCILAIWIFSVHRQITFILGKDMGLKRDEVLVVDLPVVSSNETFINIIIGSTEHTQISEA